MLLRARPRVMISSTITEAELVAVRDVVSHGLEASGIADGWLFELHAVASGGPPERQYLEAATTCDIYVVIVAAVASAATEAEYEAAFADNPTKVLPFFLGAKTPDTAAFRSMIDSRHTRVQRGDVATLPRLIVDAVIGHLQSGEAVRLPLLADLTARLERSEAVVRVGIPVCFATFLAPAALRDPSAVRPSAERVLASTALATHPRVALEGIGGSGKTHAALVMAGHVSRRGAVPALPVVLTPADDWTDVTELIRRALDAVRLYADDALINELARSGRLALVVDGTDALTADKRRALMESLDAFGARFPRLRVVCCMRRSLPNELPTYDRFSVEPMSDQQTADMFEALGVQRFGRFPDQVADLARWPFWAWSLVEVGPGAGTGLELLRDLLNRRIASAAPFGPSEVGMLTEVAAALAHAAWPDPRIDLPTALDAAAEWSSSDFVKQRYSPPPASDMLDRLGACGVLQHVGDLVFAHPLFATYLAAVHATTRGALTDGMTRDPEFAMFAAALLPSRRSAEQLKLLQEHGPLGQARYLRLVSAGDRQPQLDDGSAFDRAVELLDGVGAECMVSEAWTAWRPSTSSSAATADIDTWLADGEVAFMRGNVFRHRSPVELAAIEALARFKRRVLDAQPNADPFKRADESTLRSWQRLQPHELDDALIQAAKDWRADWCATADKLGVARLAEVAMPDGEPVITFVLKWPDPPVRLDWGATAKVVRLKNEPATGPGFSRLSSILDPGRSARVYRDIVAIVEKALGCPFSSQAWTRPELVAAWAW
jgi:hypothetical protein